MNCDKCKKACTQASNGPGVPAGLWYCDDCARGAGVRVPAVALSDALEIARRAKVEADAADKAARRAARSERARAMAEEFNRKRAEAKATAPAKAEPEKLAIAVEVEGAPEAPEALPAVLSLAPAPATFALVPEAPARPGPVSGPATPKFKPCVSGAHTVCTRAYFDNHGDAVRCACACHVQRAMFAPATPKPQGSLF